MSSIENKTEWIPTLQEGWEQIKIERHKTCNTADIIHFEENDDFIIIAVHRTDPFVFRLDKGTKETHFCWTSASLKERYYRCLHKTGGEIRINENLVSGKIYRALLNYLEVKKVEDVKPWEPSLQDGWQDVDVSGLTMFGRPISGIVHFEETDEYIIAGFDEEDPLYMKLDKATETAYWEWVGTDENGKHFYRYNKVKNETEMDLTYGERSGYIEGDIFKRLLDYHNKKKGQNMESNTENKIHGAENLKLPEGYTLLSFEREGNVVTVEVSYSSSHTGFVRYDYDSDEEWCNWISPDKSKLYKYYGTSRSNGTISGPVAQAIKDMIDAENESHQGDEGVQEPGPQSTKSDNLSDPEDPVQEYPDTNNVSHIIDHEAGTITMQYAANPGDMSEPYLEEDEIHDSVWHTNLLEAPEYETILITGMVEDYNGYRRFSVIGQREGSDFVPLHEENYFGDSKFPLFAQNVKWCLIESPVDGD